MSAIETDSGHVLAVTIANVGTVLEGDHALGVTSLTVDDCADFDDTFGGQLVIDGVTYTYSSVDDEASTIAITPALTADQDDQTAVDLLDPLTNLIATESIASVTLDGTDPGDALQVPVRAALLERLASGIRGIVGESVTLQRDESGVWELVDVLGQGSAESGSARRDAWATDSFTIAGAGDLTATLSHTPLTGSEQVFWNGLRLERTEFTRSGQSITVADPGFLSDDVVSVDYPWDSTTPVVVPPAEDYLAAVLPDDPIAVWMMDETSDFTLEDSSAFTTHTLTRYGGSLGAATVMPTSTGSYDFPGLTTSDYCGLPFVGWQQSASFTVTAWINLDSVSSYRTIWSRDSAGTRGPSFYVTGGKLNLYQTADNLASTTLSTGTDYFVAVTYDHPSTTIKFYIDGVADGSPITASMNNTDVQDLLLGASRAGIGGQNFLFDGRMGPVVYFGGALSASRLLAHYEAGLS